MLRVYAEYHNEHRPHRALEQRPPLAQPPPAAQWSVVHVRRRDRLGGLLREYELAAEPLPSFLHGS